MGAAVVVLKNLAVPMRDGVALAADVYRPADGGPAPTLVTRTPYGKAFTHYISLDGDGPIVMTKRVEDA